MITKVVVNRCTKCQSDTITKNIIGILLFALSFSLLSSLFIVLFDDVGNGVSTTILIISGVVGIFGLSISAGVSVNQTSIQLREQIRFLMPSYHQIYQFTKQLIRPGLFIGIILGLILWLYFAVIYAIDEGISPAFIIALPIFGLLFALISGIIVGLLSSIIGIPATFFDMSSVDKRPQPGRRIRASLRNALRITLFVVLFFSIFGFLAMLIVKHRDFFILLLPIFANILSPVFTWFGGLAWCQHWALRIVIAQQKWLPQRLISWLEGMVELGLLRRVGGGYIFIHRSLLEYFAELEEWPEGAEIW